MLQLSVIIPTLNEEHYIGELLGCLSRQSIHNFEVIVVDAGSQDQTTSIVQSFTKHFDEERLRLIVPGRKGVSYQRNVGAVNARCESLLFLDADVQVKEKFVENAIWELNRRKLLLATCHFDPMSTRVDDKLLYSLASAYIGTLQFIEPVSMGWCIFSTKRVHEDIGGFDEQMKFGEDYDYVQRATKYGYKLKILHSVKVYISVRRLDDEGRLTYYKKAVLSEVYRFVNGKVDKELFDYEFGKFHEDLSAKKYNGKKDFWKKVFEQLKEPFRL